MSMREPSESQIKARLLENFLKILNTSGGLDDVIDARQTAFVQDSKEAGKTALKIEQLSEAAFSLKTFTLPLPENASLSVFSEIPNPDEGSILFIKDLSRIRPIIQEVFPKSCWGNVSLGDALIFTAIYFCNAQVAFPGHPYLAYNNFLLQKDQQVASSRFGKKVQDCQEALFRELFSDFKADESPFAIEFANGFVTSVKISAALERAIDKQKWQKWIAPLKQASIKLSTPIRSTSALAVLFFSLLATFIFHSSSGFGLASKTTDFLASPLVLFAITGFAFVFIAHLIIRGLKVSVADVPVCRAVKSASAAKEILQNWISLEEKSSVILNQDKLDGALLIPVEEAKALLLGDPLSDNRAFLAYQTVEIPACIVAARKGLRKKLNVDGISIEDLEEKEGASEVKEENLTGELLLEAIQSAKTFLTEHREYGNLVGYIDVNLATVDKDLSFLNQDFADVMENNSKLSRIFEILKRIEKGAPDCAQDYNFLDSSEAQLLGNINDKKRLLAAFTRIANATVDPYYTLPSPTIYKKVLWFLLSVISLTLGVSFLSYIFVTGEILPSIGGVISNVGWSIPTVISLGFGAWWAAEHFLKRTSGDPYIRLSMLFGAGFVISATLSAVFGILGLTEFSLIVLAPVAAGFAVFSAVFARVAYKSAQLTSEDRVRRRHKVDSRGEWLWRGMMMVLIVGSLVGIFASLAMMLRLEEVGLLNGITDFAINIISQKSTLHIGLPWLKAFSVASFVAFGTVLFKSLKSLLTIRPSNLAEVKKHQKWVDGAVISLLISVVLGMVVFLRIMGESVFAAGGDASMLWTFLIIGLAPFFSGSTPLFKSITDPSSIDLFLKSQWFVKGGKPEKYLFYAIREVLLGGVLAASPLVLWSLGIISADSLFICASAITATTIFRVGIIVRNEMNPQVLAQAHLQCTEKAKGVSRGSGSGISLDLLGEARRSEAQVREKSSSHKSSNVSEDNSAHTPVPDELDELKSGEGSDNDNKENSKNSNSSSEFHERTPSPAPSPHHSPTLSAADPPPPLVDDEKLNLGGAHSRTSSQGSVDSDVSHFVGPPTLLESEHSDDFPNSISPAITPPRSPSHAPVPVQIPLVRDSNSPRFHSLPSAVSVDSRSMPDISLAALQTPPPTKSEDQDPGLSLT